MQVVITSSQSWVEVVSNIGGMLGLCAGISLLSLAEVIYWLLHLSFVKVAGNKDGQPALSDKRAEKKAKKMVSKKRWSIIL
jgi:hypothetical protein